LTSWSPAGPRILRCTRSVASAAPT
jgi:hypothetical protein